MQPLSGTIACLSAELRPLFLGADHLDFRIVTCPRCCFSTYAADFEELENPTAVREAIAGQTDACSHGAESPLLERYSTALVCYRARGAGINELADLALDASWVAASQELTGPLEEWRTMARDLYLQALEENLYGPGESAREYWESDMDARLRAIYLVAALSAELGQPELARTLFEKPAAERGTLGDSLGQVFEQEHTQFRIAAGTIDPAADFPRLSGLEQMVVLRSVPGPRLSCFHEKTERKSHAASNTSRRRMEHLRCPQPRRSKLRSFP